MSSVEQMMDDLAFLVERNAQVRFSRLRGTRFVTCVAEFGEKSWHAASESFPGATRQVRLNFEHWLEKEKGGSH